MATGLVLTQFDGLVAGYNTRSKAEGSAHGTPGTAAIPPLTKRDLLSVSAVGALE